MSITKKEPRKSRKRPLIDYNYKIAMQTPWPDNPNGYVVPQKQIEAFIGSQTLVKAQITVRRFMVVADAARAIGRVENVDLNWRLIRYTASLDKSEAYRTIMEAMMAAIEQGEQGIMAAYCTTRYMLEYGFEYTACCNREKLHHNKLKRIMRANESIK